MGTSSTTSLDSMSRDSFWHNRPKIKNSQSFSRFDSGQRELNARTRASTIQGGSVSPVFQHTITASPTEETGAEKNDIFTAGEDAAYGGTFPEMANSTLKIPMTFDELPIELKSLTERFLESLSAKVHPTPLSIDSLSDTFQEFYSKAESHVSTHIATLSSKLSRERTSSLKALAGSQKDQPSRCGSGDQQMLSASELLDRRKARRLLEIQRLALEEAIERAVCEKVYDRLWRHRSTDDEERDQKLRSRIAALSLVGIGLKELLAGADEIPDQIREKTVEEQDRIRDMLSGARSNLRSMAQEHYPLGKLHQLTAAHKSIVETLSQLFPASSSADEILPTLIYALITSPPETVNVISDLHFVQRFRASSKVDGEAAYCLVNLEAAVSFLETVDLSSLRADELPQGPEKVALRPTTPRASSAPMELGITPVTGSAPATDGTLQENNKPVPLPTKSQHRLSQIIATQTNRIEAASDSIRSSVLDGADQAFDTINNTLENSFRFLFGRLKEHQIQAGNETSSPVLPRTLEDARKLVSTPPPQSIADDTESTGSALEGVDESGNGDDAPSRPLQGDKVLELVGGHRQLRDRSVDSTRSGGSGGSKRVSFISNIKPPTSSPANEPAPPTPGLPTPPPVSGGAMENMRSLGNTLNPLNQFARIGFFGRAASGGGSANGSGSATPTSHLTRAGTPPSTEKEIPPAVEAPQPKTDREARRLLAVDELRRMKPPPKRYLECKDAKDLRLGEVEELLKEYQRLAAALGKVVSA